MRWHCCCGSGVAATDNDAIAVAITDAAATDAAVVAATTDNDDAADDAVATATTDNDDVATDDAAVVAVAAACVGARWVPGGFLGFGLGVRFGIESSEGRLILKKCAKITEVRSRKASLYCFSQ